MAVDTQNLAPIGSCDADTILELLGKRFRPEAIQSRKIGGRQMPYVPVSAVIDRLNRKCKSWHFRIASRGTETMSLNRWNEQTG